MNTIKTDEKIAWQFKPQPKGYPEKEDTGEEFFSNADIVSEVSALVRESIQNSLDERFDDTKPVVMKFFVGEQNPEINKKYFQNLIPHILQSKIRNAPDASKKSKYLVIEDFNTLGMEGSLSSEAIDKVSEKTERQLQKNLQKFKESFYYFEWKTGESSKGSGKRGSWGVGKVVFPRASRIKTYLVYSVRQQHAAPDGPRNILFGHCILNYRHVKGIRYIPDCQWMEMGEDSTSYPSGKSENQTSFIQDWNLSRTLNELGTSIVIPFCRDSLTTEHLKQSIIRDYFINILSGVLECQIKDEKGQSVYLSAQTLINEILKLPEDYSTKVAKSRAELLDLCHMYIRKLNAKTTIVRIEPNAEKPNDWLSIELEEETKKFIETSMVSGNTVEVRVPVFVPKTVDFGEAWDTFTVLLQGTKEPSASTVFCREGILIPNANRDSKLQETLSLVLVGDVSSDGPQKDNSIANLLKWSEGPSHESWNVTATKFKDRYEPEEEGKKAIRWVKFSAERILDLSRNLEDQLDERSLSEYAPDNEDGMGIPTPVVNNEPKVTLTLQRHMDSKTSGTLRWFATNFEQRNYSVYEVGTSNTHLISGSSEKTFNLKKYALSTSQIFFVEISDETKSIESNRVTLKPQVTTTQKIYIEERSGGFSVSSISKLAIGSKITVQASYASRSNNSIKNWTVEDFNIKNRMNKRSIQGLKMLQILENFAIFITTETEFYAEFVGFDPLRDLLVSTSLIEAK